MRENNKHLLRWLRALFYIHVVSTLLSVLALVATILSIYVGAWYTWAQRAVNLGIAVCLYLLPGKYRYAGILKALAMLCTLVSLVLSPMLNTYIQSIAYTGAIDWLSHCATILNFLALVLEYMTHAQISVGNKGKWYILLGCSLAISLTSNTVAYFWQPILDTYETETIVRFTNVWNVVARTLGLFLSIANLVLLHRLLRAKEQEK